MIETIYETQEAVKRRKKGGIIGSINHSAIQLNIIEQFILKYRGVYRAVPELSLDLNGKERVPDLSIYKKFSTQIGNDETRTKKMPLAVIEILSPTQSLSELVTKSNEYFDAGISSYWLVAPDVETIFIYSAKNQRTTFTDNAILKDAQLEVELSLVDIFA